MATFNDLEDNFRNFIIQEQSDAHSSRNMNVTKYNNIKIWMAPNKYHQPHFFVRISISEAVFSLNDCTKINGGLGFEERFVSKWYSRMGIKDKLTELWNSAGKDQNKEKKD